MTEIELSYFLWILYPNLSLGSHLSPYMVYDRSYVNLTSADAGAMYYHIVYDIETAYLLL